jgi:hypothetical protein
VCVCVCACVQTIDGPEDGSNKWQWKELILQLVSQSEPSPLKLTPRQHPLPILSSRLYTDFHVYGMRIQ